MHTKTQSRDNLLDHETPVATVGADEDETYTAVDSLGAQTPEEKRFLLLVERGDVGSVKRMLDQYRAQPDILLIDCVDPLGRSGLTIAIENENYDLIELLLHEGVQVKDALLHAIKEEYVEAVELLLEWEEAHHQPGTPYSWEAADRDTATFTPDITPLILAAHKNNYEIIKILLDRGATIPVPHDVKCGCDICVSAAAEDSLRYSRSRINAYRALASPSLICLSSKDPFLTAFELSWELRRLAKAEAEFRAEYNELRTQCQDFATMLLSHARTSMELQTLLNYNKSWLDDQDAWEPGDRQTLDRLKLAIKYKQKKFVAHASVQQLLAAMWYEGLPGFRRKTLLAQILDVTKLGMMFPIYSLRYMISPNSEEGKFLKKPFVKFICHSASYVFFLTLLAAASQRFEYVLLDWFGNEWMHEILRDWHRRERGALPGLVESVIVVYIFGWIWAEIKALWSDGLVEYISDLWNVVDFITNNFYISWIALRATAFYCVMRESWEGKDPYYPRELWDTFDPMLLAEAAFGAAMIFSFLKLVHIFSINPHLGPLQISLGRMIVDILQFFFIYTLVLFAFGCGLNQLLWYYADLEKKKCYSLSNNQPDFDGGDSCFIWRRFANLFETSQSLFWASFGLVELDAFELTGIKGFTRFWGMLMFGSYSVINVTVLLNMLIAMMSNSYQIISERSDTEWKFARSKLWISYFDEGATVPAPFNIIPTFKSIARLICCGKKFKRGTSTKGGAMKRYMHTTRLLVRRFVSTEEYRKQVQAGITEDDVNEIRQDISSFRYEIIDVLRTNGMKTPNLKPGAVLVSGRKGKVMERRLMKDFQIGVIENAVKEAITSDTSSKDVFARIAKVIGAKREKKDWNALVRHVSVKADPIGSKQTSIKRKRKSVRRRRIEVENAELFSMDPDRLAEYNPKLQDVSAATRLAYAKFKTKMLISHLSDGSGDSSPYDTPYLKPRLWTVSKKQKILDLKSMRSASTGDIRPRVADITKAEDSPVTIDSRETPITKPLNNALKELPSDVPKINLVSSPEPQSWGTRRKSSFSDSVRESFVTMEVTPEQHTVVELEEDSLKVDQETEKNQFNSVPMDSAVEDNVQEETVSVNKGKRRRISSETSAKGRSDFSVKGAGRRTSSPAVSGRDDRAASKLKGSKGRRTSSPAVTGQNYIPEEGISGRRTSDLSMGKINTWTGRSAVTGQTRTGWI